ncbi:hypothetical protein [Serratia phage BUCT660]|nr:hypothetical protein [Serratia phage BUCT660]
MGNLIVKFDYPAGIRAKIKEWVKNNPFFEALIFSMVIESKIDTMFACPEIEGLADKFKGNYESLEDHLDGKEFSHAKPTELGLDVIANKDKDKLLDYSPMRSINDIRFFKDQEEMKKWFKGPGKHCSRFILICSTVVLKEYGVVNSNQGNDLEECLKINGKMFDYITAKKAQWAVLNFNVNGNEGAINNSSRVIERLITLTMNAKRKARGRDAGKLIAPIEN